MPPPPWTEPAMPPAPGPGPDAPPPPGPGPDVPPPPAWFGPAPSPLALMVPVHAAPNKTAMASPAQPRARCCAAREPTSRREHDDGSLVQLTSLFLSEVRAVFSSRQSRHQRAGVNRRKGHWADLCLFVKRTFLIFANRAAARRQGDFLTRSEGEMQMAMVAAHAAAFTCRGDATAPRRSDE